MADEHAPLDCLPGDSTGIYRFSRSRRRSRSGYRGAECSAPLRERKGWCSAVSGRRPFQPEITLRAIGLADGGRRIRLGEERSGFVVWRRPRGGFCRVQFLEEEMMRLDLDYNVLAALILLGRLAELTWPCTDSCEQLPREGPYGAPGPAGRDKAMRGTRGANVHRPAASARDKTACLTCHFARWHGRCWLRAAPMIPARLTSARQTR